MNLFSRRKSDNLPRHVNPTGSANVFSYHTNRSRTETPLGRNQASLERKFANNLSGHGIRIIIVTVACLSIVGYLFWADINPEVEILADAAGSSLLQPTKNYQKAGQEILSKSFLNRLKLTVNTSAVEREMKSRFPEIADVAVTVPISGRRLLFKIQPAKPTALMISKAGQTFIIDKRGVAVVESNKAPKIHNLNLPIVKDESGLDIQSGRAILPEDNLIFITSVIAQLKAKEIGIEFLSLPTVANELHMRPTGEGYFVKFNMVGDARLQAGALVAVQKKLRNENKKPAEYVDVRLQDRVFYK